MPLPEPAPREHLHTRQIECRGYRRDDGLWDIEGTLVDTKTYGFFSHARGDVEPGQPVHNMSIRLTIDDDLVNPRTQFHPQDCQLHQGGQHFKRHDC